MSQQAPFEIIAGPFTVYVAPAGEAMADLDDADPAAVGNWALLGTGGAENIDEDGVTVTHEQTIEEFTPVGLTVAKKSFRTNESLVVAFNLVDISAAEYAQVMDNATVTDTAAGASTVGHQAFPLMKGPTVYQYALLIRGQESPDADAAGSTLYTQFEIPRCYQNGSPELVFKKGEPARLPLEFRALYDTSSGGMGTYRTGDAAATG